MTSPKHKNAVKSSWCFVDLKYVVIFLLLVFGLIFVSVSDIALNNCLEAGYTLNECNEMLNKVSN